MVPASHGVGGAGGVVMFLVAVLANGSFETLAFVSLPHRLASNRRKKTHLIHWFQWMHRDAKGGGLLFRFTQSVSEAYLQSEAEGETDETRYSAFCILAFLSIA